MAYLKNCKTNRNKFKISRYTQFTSSIVLLHFNLYALCVLNYIKKCSVSFHSLEYGSWFHKKMLILVLYWHFEAITPTTNNFWNFLLISITWSPNINFGEHFLPTCSIVPDLLDFLKIYYKMCEILLTCILVNNTVYWFHSSI